MLGRWTTPPPPRRRESTLVGLEASILYAAEPPLTSEFERAGWFSWRVRSCALRGAQLACGARSAPSGCVPRVSPSPVGSPHLLAALVVARALVGRRPEDKMTPRR